MEIRQLETFVSVADEGRCVAVARRFGVSPATISARIGRLERSLGVRLLRRTTRHVGLTPAGARLLPEIRALVDATAELRERAARVREGHEGTIRIATLGHRRGAALRVAGFLRRTLPGWEVQVTVIGRRAMLDVFRDELADVGLGPVRASRSEVCRVRIGERQRRGDVIAWRQGLPEPARSAIARIAERLGAIVRRRSYPGPGEEVQRVASLFAAVERVLAAWGVPGEPRVTRSSGLLGGSRLGRGSGLSELSRRPSGNGGGDGP